MLCGSFEKRVKILKERIGLISRFDISSRFMPCLLHRYVDLIETLSKYAFGWSPNSSVISELTCLNMLERRTLIKELFYKSCKLTAVTQITSIVTFDTNMGIGWLKESTGSITVIEHLSIVFIILGSFAEFIQITKSL